MSEDDAVLAGELALGLLEGQERAEALRRVAADRAFAREVERWRDRFAALHLEAPRVQPTRAVGRRALAVPGAGPARERRWQWIAGLTSLAAAVLLVLLLARPAEVRTPPSSPLIAVMKPTRGAPFGVVFDAARREVRLSGAVVVPAGRDAELWAIGADGVPHAAGLLGRAPRERLVVAAAVVISPGTTLAISVEPPGGSPKATPTGPVVATGKLIQA